VIAPPTALGSQRPLRVHVVGNSCAVLVEPEHGPRDGGTYGEQLGPMLAGRGVPTVVSHAGTWFGMVCDVLAHYERDVRDHFADVLVINFGMAECQSDLLPTPIVRHLTTWHRTSRVGTGTYRSRLLPPVWRQLRRYQQWASAHDNGATHRLGPRRFVADLTRTIDMVRKDCGSLVLLLDIDPPGERVEHWLPGTTARAERYNALLAEVAGRYDDGVRLVPAGALLADPASELPDGLHRSPAGHARTAELLADEICGWLAS
jgi:lysophospholipase L1-like esterase